MIPQDCNVPGPISPVVGWYDVERVFVPGGSLPTCEHNTLPAIVRTLQNLTSVATVDISTHHTSPLLSPLDRRENHDAPLRQ